MTTRPQLHEAPGAFGSERTEISAGPTIRESEATSAVPAIQMSGCRTVVTVHRTPGLNHSDATTYITPKQTVQRARSPIALLAGATAASAEGGPWRQPVLGDQRIIELERQR